MWDLAMLSQLDTMTHDVHLAYNPSRRRSDQEQLCLRTPADEAAAVSRIRRPLQWTVSRPPIRWGRFGSSARSFLAASEILRPSTGMG